MAEQDNEKQLDQLLDSLLSRYSDAQPRPGLETRILATVRAQAGKQKRPGWKQIWMWAGAAAAIAIIAVVMMMNYRAQKVPGSPTIANTPQPAVIPLKHSSAEHQRLAEEPPERKHSALPHPGPVVVSDVRHEVRQDVFPAPAPPSEQERLLLGYLASTPQQEVIAQSRPDRPPLEEEIVPETQPVVPRSNSTR